MAHSIKPAGEGLARQATKDIRQAGLIDESAVDDELGTGREVVVYGFDGLLMAVDRHGVGADVRADLVSTAAEATDSMHLGESARVTQRGNGFQVQLPGCREAGFADGDDVRTRPGDGVLFVFADGDVNTSRLVDDLIAIRQGQDT
jgi:hypothetical protein